MLEHFYHRIAKQRDFAGISKEAQTRAKQSIQFSTISNREETVADRSQNEAAKRSSRVHQPIPIPLRAPALTLSRIV